ncbi:putative dispersed gene family protein 1 (DGF-1) [Trypanosoma rangeli]|uniref:Putative dispersed gene family protein 1 (DGF-1) n=1 Tax=Trypanosoma rangeli TaxID=5698 RepID=A0A3R7MLT7_TRYRA|nr:putative dispersed gene family protein 1 (DGF-1) [Trypanosoma rangeli]RNF08180.1 putative dispersed gene family protein 1 (DGF-1) [Trypanosoma rangeli]|eukprot:RNF08180.1 putative dispersed gene family protein 1 (DGF-1) [Trypanosoma rangeli]
MPATTLTGECASMQRFDDEREDERRQERLQKLRRDAEYERLLGSDEMAEVLMYGASSREERIMQMDALVETQRKISWRASTAHAIVLSANVLTMAIMASQLAMYRWKVTEVQTLTEATAIIQQQIMRARKSGLKVRRAAATTSSRAKIFTRSSPLAAHSAADRNDPPWADEKEGDAAASAGGEAAHTMNEDERNARPASACSSICSAEGEELELGQNLPRDDMVARLVVVDVCTHEPFRDIVDYLRYFDRENNMGLIIVLMLHENYDSHTPGMLRLPKHSTTAAEAYSFGYDLVLRRCFDHTVVNFFTEMFMSSAGRWCNDIRSKGVVGNYRGMRQILLENDDMGQLGGGLADLEAHNGNDNVGLSRYLQNKRVPQSSATSVMPQPQDLPNVSSAVSSARQHHHEQPPQHLSSMFGIKDALAHLMTPAKSVKHVTKRSLSMSGFPGDSRTGTISSGREESEELYEDVLVEEKDEVEATVAAAYKEEILRLLTDLECSNRTVILLREEIAYLQESILSSTNLATHSSQLSTSNNDTVVDKHTSIAKEQQIMMLRQRLFSLSEKLMAYEMQQKLHPQSRQIQRQRSKDGQMSHTPADRFCTAGSEEETQDFSDATMLHRFQPLESSRIERTSCRLQTPTTSLFSTRPEEVNMVDAQNTTAFPLVNLQQDDKGASSGGSELELVRRLENENRHMGERLCDALETIVAQRQLIAQLEENVNTAKQGKKSKKDKKRVEEYSDDDDGAGQHRGEGGGGGTKTRRGKTGALTSSGRNSSWVGDAVPRVFTKLPSPTFTREERSGTRVKDVQREGAHGRLKHRQEEMGTKLPSHVAVPGRQRKAGTQGPGKRSQVRPHDTPTHKPLLASEKEPVKEFKNDKHNSNELKHIFSDIAAAKSGGNEEAAEEVRSQAREVAQKCAARQLEANGLKKTLQDVEVVTHGNRDSSVETPRQVHWGAAKTAEEVLERGENTEAFAHAVLSAHAAEQKVPRLPRGEVKEVVTDGTGGASADCGDATMNEGGDIVESDDRRNGGVGVRRDSSHKRSHPDLDGSLQGPRRFHHERRENKEERNQNKPPPKMYRVPEGGVALPVTQMKQSLGAVMNSSRDPDEESMRTIGIELYLDHHQALLRFMQQVGSYNAILRTVLQEPAEELEKQIREEVYRRDGNVSAQFLIAMDTALLSRLAALFSDDESLRARSLLDVPPPESGLLESPASPQYHRSTVSFGSPRGSRSPTAVEEVERLLNRLDITVDEIPLWMLDLLESGDAEAAALLREDPDVSPWVREALVSIEEAQKKHGKGITELLREHRQKVLRDRLRRSRWANAVRNRFSSSSSSSSRSSSSSSDNSGGSEDAKEVEGPPSVSASPRRVVSTSAYRCGVPLKQRRALLRCISLRNQDIFQLEPNGDVAQEVSRRLLRLRRRGASYQDVLPPVVARGLSREQQAQSMHEVSGVALPLEVPQGVVCARSRGLNPARHGVTCKAGEVSYSPFTPEELADRIMSYRLAFSRLRGTDRLPAGMTAVLPSFAIPVAAASIPAASPIDAGPMRRPLPHRQGLQVEYASWIYGVPTEQLFPMLRREQPEASDAVVFLPARSYANASGTNATHHIGTAFVRRMLARVDLFSSPATFAARRLNEQLRAAMPEWQRGVIGRAITPATRESQTRRPQPSEAMTTTTAPQAPLPQRSAPKEEQ